MAVSQASIMQALEKMSSGLNRDEFIFSFLDAYGFPKSTITRLRNGGDSRNVGQGNDIGLKKKLYFRVVPTGGDVSAEADTLKDSDIIARNDIRFVITTDFQTLVAFDLNADERLETSLDELSKNYAFFLPLAGYEKAVMYSEHPADLKASEKMGQLFDLIRERNDLSKPADIHALNVFLTRLLFCFYAEDTGIFTERQMTSTLEACTREDGSDVDQFFSDLFTVLNLPDQSPERQRMPEHFRQFRYVNGGLFRADEPIPEFGRKARRILLDCGSLDWSQINPDIFGSMFQAVIDEEQRGNLGQHYTSVSNIMKVIQPLFLDALYADLEKSRQSEKRLKELLLRLQNLRIFDPACGSGNFLIIAYKELRKLEMEIINALNALGKQAEMYYSGIKLTQFYGIKIDDFAHEVATLSLWLAEHQMNMMFKEKFGYAEAALPLRDGGNVVCGNSLEADWATICPPRDAQCSAYEVYICGNPPFIGKKEQSEKQKQEIKEVFVGVEGAGVLDYVSCWYRKAAEYMETSRDTQAAFVSTNSITQGEQVGVLWADLLSRGLCINFAHRAFQWKNSAKGKAAVHCVIIGFGLKKREKKELYIYPNPKSNPLSILAENINPYLVDYNDVIVRARTQVLSSCPEIIKGNEATDDGHLIISSQEKEDILFKYPLVKDWIRPFLGGNDFINGLQRWCLWLENVSPDEIKQIPPIQRRVELVRKFRTASSKAATRKKAETPWLFGENRQPKSGAFILVPKVSSERRDYAPIAFVDSSIVVNNTTQFVPYSSLYHFGILQSIMHMTWLDGIGGRMKSDYQYSIKLIYNTFPWPDASEVKRKHIESLAEEVLLIREDYPDKSLANLYDPKKMPAPLLAAHKALDRAVEALYRDRPFRDTSERLEHLFNRYEKLIAEEQARAPVKKTRGGK